MSSNNGFMGWVQKNPGTAFAIFLVFAAIVTVIVMVSRRPATSAGPGAASGLPVLEVSGTKVVSSTKTSGYAMKYEYLGEHLGDNVNFTIRINTKSGFEQNGITSLNVFRYKPDATEPSGKKLLGTMPITGITNYGTYEVTFLGGALQEDAVPSTGGDQIFEVVGLLSDDTPYYPPDESGTYGKVLATTEGTGNEPRIDVTDLNYVLSKATTKEFSWTVTGASTLAFEKSAALKSKYTLSILPGKEVFMVPGTAAGTYTFKYMEGTIETPFTVGNITEFKLDQPDKTKQVFLMYATMAEGTTGIVTRDGGSSGGALVLKDPRDMTGAEFTMAKVTIDDFPPPRTNMFMRTTRQIPTTGVVRIGDPVYMTDMDCEATCAADDSCVGIFFTDTMNSGVNDGACMIQGAGTGEIGGFTDHTHYSFAAKVDVAQVFENPKFTGKSTPEVAGTAWSSYPTGWDTFMSSTAHGTVLQSWHPFARSSGKRWASSTGADQHVGIKYPGPVALKGYAVSSTSDRDNYIPGKIVIEGSSDGTTWAVIKEHDTPAGKAGYGKNNTVTLAYESLPTNETAFSQYRVRIPVGGHYNNITDFKLFTTLPA